MPRTYSERVRRHYRDHWYRDLRVYLAFGLLLWLLTEAVIAFLWFVFIWPVPLLIIEGTVTLIWAGVNAKKWRGNLIIAAEEKRRQIEEKRIELENDEEENRRRVMKQKFQDRLQVLTSFEFANRHADGYGSDDIFVHYLEGGKMHNLTEAMWNQCRFIDLNRPKCELVELKRQVQGDAYRSLGMFIHWPSGTPAFWSMEGWSMTASSVKMIDYAGDDIPLYFETGFYTDRLLKVLKFVNTYTSVADYREKTEHEWAIPMLKAIRNTHGCTKLAMLRIYMELGPEAFPEDQPFSWERLLEMDPDPRPRSRRKKQVDSGERRPVHVFLDELIQELGQNKYTTLLLNIKTSVDVSASLPKYQEMAFADIFRELCTRIAYNPSPVETANLTMHTISLINSCQPAEL